MVASATISYYFFSLKKYLISDIIEGIISLISTAYLTFGWNRLPEKVDLATTLLSILISNWKSSILSEVVFVDCSCEGEYGLYVAHKKSTDLAFKKLGMMPIWPASLVLIPVNEFISSLMFSKFTKFSSKSLMLN